MGWSGSVGHSAVTLHAFDAICRSPVPTNEKGRGAPQCSSAWHPALSPKAASETTISSN
jgi:hypothetical protein